MSRGWVGGWLPTWLIDIYGTGMVGWEDGNKDMMSRRSGRHLSSTNSCGVRDSLGFGFGVGGLRIFFVP